VRRLGLYVLDQGSAKKGRYVTLLDESIQIGLEKCMLLLGFKLPDDCSQFAPLRIEDVEVLGVKVRQSWKGEEVANFIEQRMEHHADLEVAYVVSDQGTNLAKAYSLLGWSVVADCSHWLMNALKKSLVDYAPLIELTQWMGQFRQRNILSLRSHLCPATLRDKDRFARLFTILDWHQRIMELWSGLSTPDKAGLAFIQQPTMLDLFEQLKQIRHIITQAFSLLKTSGLSSYTWQLWEQRWKDIQANQQLSSIALQIGQAINDYFVHHESLMNHHGRMLCCSDIVESIFGYYKNKGGMKVISSDVLAIPLRTQVLTVELVRKGLQTVGQDQLNDWSKKNICDNRFSRLKKLRKNAKTDANAA